MSFELKKRKYNSFDFFRIPFSCAPVSTIIVTLQKILTAFANVFQVVATAEFINYSIKYVNHETEFNELLPWLIFLFVLIAWKRISWNIGRVFLKRVEVSANEQVRNEITHKIGRIKYSYIEDEKCKRLISRLTDKIDVHISEMFQRFLNLILYIIRIVGVLVIIWLAEWWLSLVVLLLMPPLLFISFKSGKKVYKSEKEYEEFNRRTIYLSDVLTSRDYVNERTLFNHSSFVNSEWEKQYTFGRKVKFKARLKQVMNVNGGSAITSILSTIIILVMVPLTIEGKMNIGMFISIATAIFDIVKLMGTEMSRVVSQLAKYREYMKDFTAFAYLEEDLSATLLPADTKVQFESIEIKNLSFKYPNTDKYILKNLNMKIEAKKHYAIVGENGTGKTTLIKIISGLYSEYEGDVYINGINLKDFPKGELKSVLKNVHQDFAKYSISVKDNILIGDVNKLGDLDLAKKKAEMVGIDLELQGLKYGYDTMVGKLHDDSVDLSGGQWQKIAIARALVGESDVKILDEPTAALDPISESNLYEEFEKISRGKTTIFITHRLGSIKLADYIYVLKDGTVFEEGTHEELDALNGLYKQMYDSQKAWYTGGEQ